MNIIYGDNCRTMPDTTGATDILLSAMHVNDHLCICETIELLHVLCFLVFVKYMQNMFSVILLRTIIVTFITAQSYTCK